MFKLGIYFSNPNPNGDPFDDPYYGISYRLLLKVFAERGIDTTIFRGDCYLGDNRFSQGYHFENEQMIPITGPLDVDVIFVKSASLFGQLTGNFRAVNPPALAEIAEDKWNTYRKFGDKMAQTLQLDPDRQAIDQISTDMVVLKPRFGFAGNGVYVLPKDKAKQQILEDIPYLVQAFIDGSGGVPGLIDGIHDFRLIMASGFKPMAFIRTPPANSLIANLARGGTITCIKPDTIPQAAHQLGHWVNSKLDQFGSLLYTIDMIFTSTGPKLVEINSQPGVLNHSTNDDEYVSGYHERLIGVLKAAAKK